MRGWTRWFLLVEVFVCFLPCALLLIMGAVMLPMQVVWLFGDSLHWEGAAIMFVAVPCGIAGLCSLLFVVSLLLAGREKIEKPVPVLGGVLAGILLVLWPLLVTLYSEGQGDWLTLPFISLLPLFATTHILYLSRNMFIAGFRHGARPLIGRGTWLAFALVVCVATFLFSLHQGHGSR